MSFYGTNGPHNMPPTRKGIGKNCITDYNNKVSLDHYISLMKCLNAIDAQIK